MDDEKKKKKKNKKKKKKEAEDSEDYKCKDGMGSGSHQPDCTYTAPVRPSHGSTLVSTLFEQINNTELEEAEEKKNMDSSDEEYGNALRARGDDANASELSRYEEGNDLGRNSSAGLGNLITGSLEGAFSLVGVLPKISVSEKESNDTTEDVRKELSVDSEGALDEVREVVASAAPPPSMPRNTLPRPNATALQQYA